MRHSESRACAEWKAATPVFRLRSSFSPCSMTSCGVLTQAPTFCPLVLDHCSVKVGPQQPAAAVLSKWTLCLYLIAYNGI